MPTIVAAQARCRWGSTIAPEASLSLAGYYYMLTGKQPDAMIAAPSTPACSCMRTQTPSTFTVAPWWERNRTYSAVAVSAIKTPAGGRSRMMKMFWRSTSERAAHTSIKR
jgi:hypothetical protein